MYFYIGDSIVCFLLIQHCVAMHNDSIFPQNTKGQGVYLYMYADIFYIGDSIVYSPDLAVCCHAQQ